MRQYFQTISEKKYGLKLSTDGKSFVPGYPFFRFFSKKLRDKLRETYKLFCFLYPHHFNFASKCLQIFAAELFAIFSLRHFGVRNFSREGGWAGGKLKLDRREVGQKGGRTGGRQDRRETEQ